MQQHLPPIGFISILLFCVPFIVSAGAATWTPHQADNTWGKPERVDLVDFNNDGSLDIIVGDFVNNKVYWYQNNGSASFTRRNVGNLTNARRAIGVDLDKDGDKDVLACAADSGDKVTWYENDGTNLSFTEHAIDTPNGAIDCTYADFDGNGAWDVVTAVYTEGKVYWYKNNGSQSFSKYTLDASFSSASSVATADLNGDGYTDIVVSSSSTLAWYKNDGTGTFTKNTVTSTGRGPVTVADMNGDGDPDIVTGSSTIYWQENSGGTSPTFTEHTACAAYASQDINVTDIDDDGDLDILGLRWTTLANADLFLCTNDGTQSFTASTVDSALNYGTGFDTGDLNGDGTKEIVAADEASKIYWYSSSDTSPAISSLSPVDDAIDVSVTANLEIEFDEEIGKSGTGYITIYKASDDSVFEQINTATGTVTGSGTTTVTINPMVTFDDATEYYVQIDAMAFPDATGNFFTGISDTTTWSFTTEDLTPPVLSALSPANAATGVSTGSSITWTTDELASSQVQYGFTSSFGNLTAVADTSPRVMTGRTVSIGTLNGCTTYYYRAISIDASGNTTTGSTIQFLTTGCTNTADVDSQTGSSLPAGNTGSLALSSGSAGAAVTIPDTVITNPVVLQIKKLDDAVAAPSGSNPSGKSLAGDHTYDVRLLSGTTVLTSFSNAIRIVMTYTSAQVTGLQESTLRIFRWNGSSWNELSSCSVDTGARTVTCYTTQFSTFGLFGTPTPSATSGDATASSGGGSGGHRGSDKGMAETIALAYEKFLAKRSGREVVEIEEGEEVVEDVEDVEDAEVIAESSSPLHREKLVATVNNREILYRDVPTDAWFTPYVVALIEGNIATGYADNQGKSTGEFGVGDPVTYAEVLMMALKAAGIPLQGKPARNETAQGTWAAIPVGIAEEKGYSIFLHMTTLDVHTPATRGEIIQTILEVLGLPIADAAPDFADVPNNHPYAHAIATAVFYGLIQGDATSDGTPLQTFRPDEPMNRAEAAKVIAKLRGITR